LLRGLGRIVWEGVLERGITPKSAELVGGVGGKAPGMRRPLGGSHKAPGGEERFFLGGTRRRALGVSESNPGRHEASLLLVTSGDGSGGEIRGPQGTRKGLYLKKNGL